jgi:hypothetical protein
MRELRLAQLELQPFDWYSHLEEPRQPLPGDEGERLFRHEAARSRRYGSSLSVLSIELETRGSAALRRLGEVTMACVRDCDFVSEGEPGELLVGLPEADSDGARLCVGRILGRLDEIPESLRPNVRVGLARLHKDELIEDTVARARAQRA